MSPDKTIGEYLVHFVTSMLSKNRRVTVEFDVHERDSITLNLLKKYGFKTPRENHIMKDYFDGTGGDAYVMRYQLEGAAMASNKDTDHGTESATPREQSDSQRKKSFKVKIRLSKRNARSMFACLSLKFCVGCVRNLRN